MINLLFQSAVELPYARNHPNIFCKASFTTTRISTSRYSGLSGWILNIHQFWIKFLFLWLKWVFFLSNEIYISYRNSRWWFIPFSPCVSYIALQSWNMYQVEFDLNIFTLISIEYFMSMLTSSNGNISALLALCAGISSVTGEFLAQSPVTRSFDVFLDQRLNKRLVIWDSIALILTSCNAFHKNNPCLSLGHETIVSAVCLAVFFIGHVIDFFLSWIFRFQQQWC